MSRDSRVPAKYPLRAVQPLVESVLSGLSPECQQLYAVNGRPSIGPMSVAYKAPLPDLDLAGQHRCEIELSYTR